MKYNSSAVQPTCFLLTEDSGEQEVSLEELQVRLGPERSAAWLPVLSAVVLAVACTFIQSDS